MSCKFRFKCVVIFIKIAVSLLLSRSFGNELSLIVREMNEPAMAFWKTFHNKLYQSISACLQSFSTKFCLYMLKLIHIFGNVLKINSRYYVKKFIRLCTFPKFHTHLEENLARSFQNVFDKCSRVLNLVFSRNWSFHENHHILEYHSTLREEAKLSLFSRKKIFNSIFCGKNINFPGKCH